MTTTEQPTRRARTAMDPRVAQRRASVARARSRRRGWVVMGVLAAVLLGIGAWLALHSSLFSARVVTVRGSEHTPTATILRTAGLASHPPLVSVDPGAVANALERLPWVASAAVARHWPDGVSIVIVERTPVGAVAEPNGRWALLDPTGRVLAVSPDAPHGMVHLVVHGTPPPPGAQFAAAAPAAQVAATLPAAFRDQVATVEVGSQLTLTLTSPLTVKLGSASNLGAKYEDVAAILAGATLHAGDTIDVSVPASPTVTST